MPKFLIRRDVPGAGKLSPEELQAISQRSCAVLERLGPRIQWIQSYVTADRITCVYLAPDADLIRRHAREGGFPADSVEEIVALVDPTTAEASVSLASP